GRERRLLDAEIVKNCGRLRLGKTGRRLDDRRLLDPAAPGHLADVDGAERLAEKLQVPRLLPHERLVHEPAADDRRRQAEEKIDVGTGPDAEMAVCTAGRLGLARIDDDERAFLILDEVLEALRRVVAAVADARVGAEDEHEARV